MRGRSRVGAGILAAVVMAPLAWTISSADGSQVDEVTAVADLDAASLERLPLGVRTAPASEPVARAPEGDQAIAPPPVTFAAAPVEPAAPPEVLSRPNPFAGVTPEGGPWAVIIGINDYPGGGNDLRSAVTDARDVNEALARYGVPGKRRLLITDRQATAEVIGLAAEWLVAHSGPDATAVFFFAGHVRKEGPDTEAMVGADGRLVTDRRLAELLAPLAARDTWIAMAACYGGGFTEALAPGRVLTAAASADSLAYENSKFGRSYLVEYMVRRAMINGQAPGSVEDAFAWAHDAIKRDYPARVPVQYDHTAGKVRLDMASGGPGPQGSPSPPAPSGGTSAGGTAGGGGGSGGGSSGGGGGSSGGGRKDTCTSVSLGVVRCGS